MIPSCTFEDCSCGIFCPVCDNNFVERHNKVCATCLPNAKCAHCDYKSSILHKRLKSDNDLLDETNLIMGWGVYEDSCTSCGKHGLLGDTKLCRPCALNSIDKVKYLCSVCVEDYNKELESSYVPEKSKFKPVNSLTCSVCKEDSVSLDSNGICSSCRQYSKKHFCPTCKKKTTLVDSTSILCNDCLPECRSCKSKFSPELLTELYCENCVSYAQNSRCITCENNTDVLTITLQCKTCDKVYANHDSVNFSQVYCPSCQLNATFIVYDDEGVPKLELCNRCKQISKRCPICYENYINNDQYMCTKCRT
jgi:hypothetical protein